MKIISPSFWILIATTWLTVSAVGTRGMTSIDLMGGTLRDFLRSMVGFGDITQVQMDAILGYTRGGIEDGHMETVRHEDGDASVLKAALSAYIEAELDADSLSADTADYLSGLLRLNEWSASPRMIRTPATATYSGNGNVRLLGRLGLGGTSLNNGIWGVALGGREYALQCSNKGLHIVDVTNPSSPFQVQLIPMSGGDTWRDADVHTTSSGETYAYVAAQGGTNPSMFVIRLSALSSASAPGPNSNPIPSSDIANRGFVDLGHTINVENGLLFINAAFPEAGCTILDLEANPFNPPKLPSWAGSSRDCHDSYQRNGVMVDGSPRNLLYSADGASSRFRVLDITDIRSGTSPVQLGQTASVSGVYAHSIALTEDAKTMFTFDEADVYDIGVYDVSDPTSGIPQIHTFSWSGEQSEGSAIPHNGHVRGNYLFVAYYEVGLRVFDISNPRNPLEVGKYETFRDPSDSGSVQSVQGRFSGAWNLYPYLPSGNVLVSDESNGLFVLEIDPLMPPSTPTPVPPSPTPVQSTPSPVGGGGDSSCQDQPNWHDSDGEVYDCEWYAEGNNCIDFGNEFQNFGSTATDACCVCGGGSSGGGGGTTTPAPVPPTPAPAAQPTLVPTLQPTPSPVGGGGGGDSSCLDQPNWHDSDGDTFDCVWYAQDNNCVEYGNDFENFGSTAIVACCACGGGSSGNGGGGGGDGGGNSGGSCSNDPPNWHDSDGQEFDCIWYSEGNNCAVHGDSFGNSNFGGKTANDACCTCGGGATN